MGASVGADLSRQAGPAQSIGRSASEMLEVVHQMLATIHNDGLIPVLVFDDTDRWLSGSAFADHEALARSFFGLFLAALAELRSALVVQLVKARAGTTWTQAARRAVAAQGFRSSDRASR